MNIECGMRTHIFRSQQMIQFRRKEVQFAQLSGGRKRARDWHVRCTHPPKNTVSVMKKNAESQATDPKYVKSTRNITIGQQQQQRRQRQQLRTREKAAKKNTERKE